MPRLSQFIGRANKFKVFDQAHVLFQHRYVQVGLSSQAGTVDHGTIELRILCQEADWQLSSLAQVCHWSLPPYSIIERLDIREDSRPYMRTHWQDDLDNTQWTELFRQFTTVKDLHLSEELVLRVALALQEPFGAEVLPALQNIVRMGNARPRKCRLSYLGAQIRRRAARDRSRTLTKPRNDASTPPLILARPSSPRLAKTHRSSMSKILGSPTRRQTTSCTPPR